jgi:hypothetical protein
MTFLKCDPSPFIGKLGFLREYPLFATTLVSHVRSWALTKLVKIYELYKLQLCYQLYHIAIHLLPITVVIGLYLLQILYNIIEKQNTYLVPCTVHTGDPTCGSKSCSCDEVEARCIATYTYNSTMRDACEYRYFLFTLKKEEETLQYIQDNLYQFLKNLLLKLG